MLKVLQVRLKQTQTSYGGMQLTWTYRNSNCIVSTKAYSKDNCCCWGEFCRSLHSAYTIHIKETVSQDFRPIKKILPGPLMNRPKQLWELCPALIRCQRNQWLQVHVHFDHNNRIFSRKWKSSRNRFSLFIRDPSRVLWVNKIVVWGASNKQPYLYWEYCHKNTIYITRFQ